MLAPKATETCTATYTTTQADVDTGSVTNTGTAHGTPPTGPVVTDSSTVTVPALDSPAITVLKTADPSSFDGAGTTITYSYLVTNTGNVTLSSVNVTDPHSGLSAISCPDTTLVPSASETCTATYTTTQADVDTGSITNTGTAAGTSPQNVVVTDQSTVTVPATQAPAITVSKTASVSGFNAPGVVITYSYLVTNSGNVTLHAVDVTDPHSGLSAINCPDTHAGPRRVRDLHRHLHHHPGRRGRRLGRPTPGLPPAPRRRAHR